MVDPRDCRAYRVVTIGEQTWLAENLAFETEGGSACYDDERTHCATYGRLYDWAATMGLASSANHERVRPTGPARGICPPGWHVPSGGEWERLFEAAGGRAMAAPRLRADSDLWQQGSSNDATGFGALPGGYRGHRFSLEGFQAHFQASDETSDDTAAFAFLSGISDRARLDDDSSGSDNDKTRLRSVRCLRD
ncbi:MAG TPA: fibrobacter succinogenes major paralogous domain-containing protein [Sandaracinaceae bacterium LLY-WYZ-13_1]|nr:fibrobacter succinogenes major paralogous domain-containing protein [Sandaracinaceae bacterium LLY-WYZ-13_1]